MQDVTNKVERGCVAGLFTDDATAERAVDELRLAGFSDKNIGVATVGGPESGRHSGFWNKVTGVFGKHTEDRIEKSGSVKDSLTGCGMDDATARYFDQSLHEGNVLITVVCDDRERAIQARDILRTAGGDMGSLDASRLNAPPVSGEARVPSPVSDRNIELRGEVLHTRKERVGTGEVRMHKEVVSEKRSIEVPVEREELVVERTPGSGRPASGPVGANSNEIRVPISEERVKVEKEPVVTEEVHIHKQPVQETKHIEGEVRHEELRTDRTGKTDVPKKDKAA